jgi:aspartate/methionine/tyrosine aminotransferase
MAGWRIGWVAGARDHIDVILKVLSNVESGIFRPLQEAAVTALRLPESWHAEVRAEYRRRREHGERLAVLLGCDVRPGQVGMFVWARIPDHASGAEAFADMLLDRAQMFITPGTVFGSGGERYIRVSLCSPAAVFEEALERVRKLHLAGVRTEAV